MENLRSTGFAECRFGGILFKAELRMIFFCRVLSCKIVADCGKR